MRASARAHRRWLPSWGLGALALGAGIVTPGIGCDGGIALYMYVCGAYSIKQSRLLFDHYVALNTDGLDDATSSRADIQQTRHCTLQRM
jgi:hypothetical protein